MVELVKKDVGKGQSLKLAASFVNEVAPILLRFRQLYTLYWLTIYQYASNIDA